MNFWTGLILGLIIGWLVEWIIDWLFWRRDAAEEYGEQVPPVTVEATEREAEWQSRLETAERDYQSRLATVEGEWQSRLNLNEQQWQSQFRALESDNESLRARLGEPAAAAALVAAGAAVAGEFDEAPPGERLAAGVAAVDADLPPEEVYVELPHVTDLGDPDAGVMAFDLPAELSDEAAEQEAELPASEAAGSPAVPAVEMDYPPDRDAPDFAIDTAPPAAAVEVSDEYDTGQVTPVVAAGATRGDDLTRIRGIGPRFAAILAAGGIHTYDDLAAASPEELRDIIKPGPMRQIPFELWSSQAAAFAATRAERTGDDLTTIEGIGPVYATKLREQGITTFADLAATDEATLVGIIQAPAWRRVNYADWITQAQLAAAGDETGLSELKGRLFRREGDNLTLIHGLGPRSAAALQAAGILSFADLAAASPDQVERIVREAGVRAGGDYYNWVAEAGQRAAGKRVASRRPKAVVVLPCPQDLSVVPGVGSVFEDRLYAAGIGTYWELAETPDDELTTILDVSAFQGIDIAEIKAGAMQLAVRTNSLGRSWDGTSPDDLEALGGLGEVYERRLYEAGICTYEALAATSPERLAEICRAPAARTPDYAAWIARAAELSAAGRSG